VAAVTVLDVWPLAKAIAFNVAVVPIVIGPVNKVPVVLVGVVPSSV
jgi:hypothetical protein